MTYFELNLSFLYLYLYFSFSNFVQLNKSNHIYKNNNNGD